MPKTPEQIAEFARALAGPVGRIHAGIVARDAAKERIRAVIADPTTTEEVRRKARGDLAVLTITGDMEWSSPARQRKLAKMYPLAGVSAAEKGDG